MELAASDKSFEKLVAPSGIQLVKEASAAGLAAADTVNCCNGRVGRRLNLKDVISDLSAAGDGD
jgi:hypothetical protein